MGKFDSIKMLEDYRSSLLKMYDPEKIRVRICMTGCRAYGAAQIKKVLEEEIKKGGLEEKVEVISTGCQGFCARAPVMVIDPEDIFYQEIRVEDVSEIVSETLRKRKVIERLLYQDPVSGQRFVHTAEVPFFKEQSKMVLRNCGLIDPTNISHYIRRRGYEALSKALALRRPERVIEEIKRSGLRGRGGAGFPTGLKWEFTRAGHKGAKYIICNADEGDPGAFMDRALLEGDPHSVLEGLIIGGYAIGAEEGYVYVRAEYPIAVEHLKIALRQAEDSGLLGENILGTGFSFQVKIKQGAGVFVCGEETALIASLEGGRGMPQPRPPFPVQSGLWGRPTCINNVETLANVPLIILEGAQEYARVGTKMSKGTKIFALAGKVNNTGLVEVPIGTSLRKVVFDIGGGVPRGRKYKAVQIGGPSGGCVPERYLDLPIDYESLKQVGAIMGSGGMIVMDDNTCMVDIARFFLEFVQDESCGKCVPCRVGTKRMLEILTRITQGEGLGEDLKLLKELGRIVKDTALCGLGQTAPNPVLSTLEYFYHEYLAHIEEKRCPACSCEALFISPCQHACPLGIDIPGYINLVAQERFEDALAVIEKENPFPAICGRVCHHPCELKCRRGELDEAVAINAIKRFTADYTLERRRERVLPRLSRKEEKVAIIGSGPAGLTAAYYLARWGYQVTIFESLPVAGGMLAVGIPEYRLPKEILKRDVLDVVENLGVKIKTNTRIGKDLPFEELPKLGYQAIFVATGAHKSGRINLCSKTIRGVFSGLEYLRGVCLGNSFDLGGKTVVIGGGNVAVDAARSSLRQGVTRSIIIYRRSREEMPAVESEIEAAEEEGVEILYLAAPVKILTRNGKVRGIQCQRMKLGDYDESGRRRPVPIEGSLFTIDADSIIMAIGQSPDLSFFPSSFRVNEDGPLQVNSQTLATNRPGVFGGGDMVLGPATVVEAMAAGKKGALSIDRYLRGQPLERTPTIKKKTFEELEKEEVEPSEDLRTEVPTLPLEKRVRCFGQVELGFSKHMAVREAKRCLRCDLEQKKEQR